jgi:hypothetical protein
VSAGNLPPDGMFTLVDEGMKVRFVKYVKYIEICAWEQATMH